MIACAGLRACLAATELLAVRSAAEHADLLMFASHNAGSGSASPKCVIADPSALYPRDAARLTTALALVKILSRHAVPRGSVGPELPALLMGCICMGSAPKVLAASGAREPLVNGLTAQCTNRIRISDRIASTPSLSGTSRPGTGEVT